MSKKKRRDRDRVRSLVPSSPIINLVPAPAPAVPEYTEDQWWAEELELGRLKDQHVRESGIGSKKKVPAARIPTINPDGSEGPPAAADGDPDPEDD